MHDHSSLTLEALAWRHRYMQATRTLLDQTQDEDEHAALAIMTGDDLSDMFAGLSSQICIPFAS